MIYRKLRITPTLWADMRKVARISEELKGFAVRSVYKRVKFAHSGENIRILR